MWKSEDTPCKLVIEQTKLPRGYCCSFNYQSSGGVVQRYTNSLGYPSSSRDGVKIIKSPKALTCCGHQAGLELLIDNDLDDYFSTVRPGIKGYVVGFFTTVYLN